MSMPERWNWEVPSDTAALGEQLLGAEDPYRRIGDEASAYLRYEDFAPLYASVGRGAVCPIVLSLVLIFQYLERLPDRAAARMAVMRLDWKYALHQPLAWEGFHYSDLCHFRQRLIEHGAERLVFDRVLAWVRGHGLLRRYSKQRSDSTHIVGAVERLSRLELVWESLRLALREIAATAAEWSTQAIPAAFVETYGQRQSDWKLSEAEMAQAMGQAGRDGYWLLAQIAEGAPPAVQGLPAVATLRTVLAQQFVEEGGEVRPQRPPLRGKEVVVTPHDRETRWAKKRRTEWEGYRLEVTETVETERGERFLTDIDAVPANVGDSEEVAAIQERLAVRALTPSEHYVDQGYTSGANLAQSARRGIALVGPVALDQNQKPVGYRQADFAIDLASETAFCPQGRPAVAWRACPVSAAPDDPQHREIRVSFECTGCPVHELCTSGRHRTLTIHAFQEEIAERRAEQGSATFRERMKQRAGIEGTISELVRGHGARRARYRGHVKGRLQYLLMGAAVNLKRLARALARPLCEAAGAEPVMA